MMSIRASVVLAALVSAASVAACSSSPSSNGSAASADGGSAEDAGLSADESATFSSSGDSLAANQESATLADSLFDFDPTIDPKATPGVNATAIGANIQANLGSACGQVSVSGTTVSVTFGAPPGCTLADGPQVSGTVSLGVSEASGTTTIALTLTDVVVNGESLDGQSSFATTDGSTFAVTSSMTSGSKSNTSNLTVVGGSSSFSVSGTSSVTEGGATSNVTFNDVVHVKGECYATSGTMSVSTGATSETITFDASTPSTGEVTVQIGKRTTTTTLPAYGSCPSDGQSSQGRDAGSRRD